MSDDIQLPEVVAWRWRKPVVNDQGETVGATAWELSDAPEFLPWWTNDPLVRLSDYEALQAECEKLRRDAARWRFVAQFMQLDDVGDDQYCLGLTVDHETLEEMVTAQASRLDVERRSLEWADVQGPEDSPKTLPPITLEEAIDAAIDKARGKEVAE